MYDLSCKFHCSSNPVGLLWSIYVITVLCHCCFTAHTNSLIFISVFHDYRHGTTTNYSQTCSKGHLQEKDSYSVDDFLSKLCIFTSKKKDTCKIRTLFSGPIIVLFLQVWLLYTMFIFQQQKLWNKLSNCFYVYYPHSKPWCSFVIIYSASVLCNCCFRVNTNIDFHLSIP